MKNIKIGLVIFVVAIIGVFIYDSQTKIDPIDETTLTTNPFTALVEQKIDSLSKLPVDKFSKNYFDQVTYLIDDYHQSGRLGEGQSDNDQMKDILSKNLYSVYTEKFLSQAFYVFNGSDWKNEDLNFIRVEYQILQNSPFLENGSPIDHRFDEVRRILNQYDVITKFVSTCRNFSYYETGLSDRFPLAEVKSLIYQAARYRKSGLGNSTVNNCARLHNDLNNVSNFLFLAHVNYLNNKIEAWSGMYTNYNSQKTYADNLYRQLAKEIEELDNNLYNSEVFYTQYTRLKEKWGKDATNSYKHFNK